VIGNWGSARPVPAFTLPNLSNASVHAYTYRMIQF
jgi:hypothetical protein